MSRWTPILRLASAAVLGATTTVSVAWALARWRTVPPYPRTTLRAFMVNGRAWSTTEVRLWGAHDIWWMDLEFDELREQRIDVIEQRTAMKEGRTVHLRSPRNATTLCEEARVSFVELAKQRPGTLALNSPPPWGSFTDPASLPPFDKSGNDAAFGLPMPCLWYRVVGQMTGNLTFGGPVEGGILVSGQASSRGTGDYRALPLRPIWTGLIVNLALWTACWWLLLLAPAAWRRSRRRRRGLCLRCGYDLRGLAPGSTCPECGRPSAPQGLDVGTLG